MKDTATKWFVFGAVFGVVALLVGLYLSPGLAPKTATADEQAATEELTKVMTRLTELIEESQAESSNDARTACLESDLQTIRSQLELWKIQHNDALPGNIPGVTMQEQLTGKTNADGSLNPNGDYGPYLHLFPTNPYTGTNTVAANADGSTNGWIYDPQTGAFHADNVPDDAN